jgi:outer membrane protein OmpA-like peptidoglycan-associated protein
MDIPTQQTVKKAIKNYHKRAEAVRSYLISKGIPENRISIYAEGEDNPVSTNATSQGRQQNRRVEIVAMNS